MLALGLQALGIGGERVEHEASGRAVDAGQVGRVGLEDARVCAGAGEELRGRGFSGGRLVDGNGEGVEVVERRGALGSGKNLRDGLDVVQAMHLVARELQHRHAGEEVDGGAVIGEERERGFDAQAALGAGVVAGEDEAGGHAFDVPLEGAADGLVEVVEVEDEAAVGGGEGAEVADVGVAAELGMDAGVGAEREVVRHHGNRAAEVSEGRKRHAIGLDADEGGDATAHGLGEQLQGVGAAEFWLPSGVAGAGHLAAMRLAKGEAFA